MDVDLRQSLEEQLRQSRKMEAIGRVAGEIAHDLNNVLTAILGYTDLLLEDAGADDQRRRDVWAIVQAAWRASTLTHQLMALSRRQTVSRTTVDLNAIIVGLSDGLRRLVGDRVELVLELASALAPVGAGSGQLEQLIVNLVANARDAMPDGGRVTIRTAATSIDASEASSLNVAPGSFVLLTISDTGVGMSQEVQRRLFEPFFTTRNRGKTKGFGLAMVHSIVTQNGGHIRVLSEPGRGTTVHIFLPSSDADRKPSVPAGGELPGRTETLLVVEDDDAARLLLRVLLEKSGYEVLEASSDQAPRVFAEHAGGIALIVADVSLSATPAFGALRQQRPDLKVLYTLGYPGDGIVGAVDVDRRTPVLQKPFTVERLLGKVRETLGR